MGRRNSFTTQINDWKLRIASDNNSVDLIFRLTSIASILSLKDWSSNGLSWIFNREWAIGTETSYPYSSIHSMFVMTITDKWCFILLVLTGLFRSGESVKSALRNFCIRCCIFHYGHSSIPCRLYLRLAAGVIISCRFVSQVSDGWIFPLRYAKLEIHKLQLQ